MNDAIWNYMRLSIRRLLRENPCDLLVSVHPMINHSIARIAHGAGIPFITVVTDMVTTHGAWYDRRAETVIVATERARQRGLILGLNPEQVVLVGGLPVADRFCRPTADRETLRQNLGWPQDQPVVLLVGGGEGMGPVEAVAHSIDRAGLPMTLVVIAGRNRKLKEKLEKSEWNIPVLVYGFVSEMPNFMRAADILVTKAGPGTICEAFIADLPIVLYSHMPGQEDGNVTFVVNEGAGVWAPDPESVPVTLRRWLEHPEERLKAVAACQRLARPQAARQIARILANRIGIFETPGGEYANPGSKHA
jgi:1,2-diacylglycerol 3-beta-galactosyltransferase